MGLPAFPISRDEYIRQQEAKDKAEEEKKRQKANDDNDDDNPNPQQPHWHDPEQWCQAAQPHVIVQIHSLTSEQHQHYNGELALVVGTDPAHGRYLCHLCTEQRRVSFQPKNLRRASWGLALLGRAQMVRHHPATVQLWSNVARKLGGGGAAAGILVLLVVLWMTSCYLLGFNKTMTLTACFLLGGMLIMGNNSSNNNNGPLGQRVRRNLKVLIRETLPYGEQIATTPYGPTLVVISWTAYVIWTVVFR